MEISTVQLDIARFVKEVYTRPKGELEEWVVSLADCLAERDKSLNKFGARLLGEVEGYREKERKRKERRKKRFSKDSADSKDSVENPHTITQPHKQTTTQFKRSKNLSG